jgi:hypothetical protein
VTRHFIRFPYKFPYSMHFSLSEQIMLSNSSAGIALGYGLHDRGYRVRFPAEAGNFSLHNRVQTGSGAQPTPYPMVTRGSFPGGKAVGV